MTEFSMMFNILMWLFILGTILNVIYCITLTISFRRTIEEERMEREEIIQRLQDHQRDNLHFLTNKYEEKQTDLLNRLMANSYSEYESYKEGAPKKTKESDNFIKQSIDQAERNYIRERQLMNEE